MSRVAAIPLSLLGDTARVEPPDPHSEFASHYLEPVTYERVRLDLDVAAFDSEWAEDDAVNAVLFVDAQNSRPAEPPEMRSRVTVTRGGRSYVGQVRSVRELIGYGAQVHHWEVGLG